MPPATAKSNNKMSKCYREVMVGLLLCACFVCHVLLAIVHWSGVHRKYRIFMKFWRKQKYPNELHMFAGLCLKAMWMMISPDTRPKLGPQKLSRGTSLNFFKKRKEKRPWRASATINPPPTMCQGDSSRLYIIFLYGKKLIVSPYSFVGYG